MILGTARFDYCPDEDAYQTADGGGYICGTGLEELWPPLVFEKPGRIWLEVHNRFHPWWESLRVFAYHHPSEADMCAVVWDRNRYWDCIGPFADTLLREVQDDVTIDVNSIRLRERWIRLLYEPGS